LLDEQYKMSKKIALCFLTYENLSQPKLWKNIIDENQDKVHIYIHNKHDFKDEEYGLDQYCIKNRTETRYGHISLVQATLQLFEEAYKNSENTFFVLLSDKTIPLYSFDFIYDRILEWNNNIISNESWKSIERFDDLTNPAFFDKKTFSKQSQWMILKRETVFFFITNRFTYLYSDRFWAADEHYFINICIKFCIPYLEKLITYTNWEEQKCSPKTYDYLSNEIIKNIKKNPDLLFMRKVSQKCILPSYFDDF